MSLEDGSRIEVNATSVAVIGATHEIDAAKKTGLPEVQRDAMMGLLRVLVEKPGAIDVLAATQGTLSPTSTSGETVLISNGEQAA